MAHLFPFIDYDCAGLAIKLGDMKNMLNHRLREGTLGSPKIIKIIPQSYFLSYGCIHRGMIAFPQEVPPKRHWQHLTCHENPSAQSCSNWQIFSEQIPWHYISCLMFLLKMRHTPQVFQHFGGKNMVIRWFPDFYNFLPPNFCNKFQRPGDRWDDQNVRFWWWWPGEIRCNFQGISDLLCNIVLSTYIDNVYYM